MSEQDNRSISRRKVVGVAGAGIMAAASKASAATQGNAGMAAVPLKDPKPAYPKPPFKRQSQPWPGLASKMEPRARSRRDKAIAAPAGSPGARP